MIAITSQHKNDEKSTEGVFYHHAATNPPPKPTKFTQTRSCDVCIIGGGFTGVSTALHLAERGFDVVLLEAGRLGCGASGRNGGQIGSGQRCDQQTLVQRYGHDHAHDLWVLAEAAKTLVKTRIARHHIPCDLQSGLIEAACKPRAWDTLRREADFLTTHYDYPYLCELDRQAVAEHIATQRYCGGLLDRDAAHIQPLAYLFGLAAAARKAGAQLYEESPVIALEQSRGVYVKTNTTTLRADYVVLACNAYLDGLVTQLARRLMPILNFVIATEPLGATRAQNLLRDNVAVNDHRFIVNYYRLSSDHRLLFGGGESWRSKPPADITAVVRPHMLWTFPQLDDIAIDYAWSGRVGITWRRMPHFGRLGTHILFAQGYSGHGVAMASLAGELLAEAIAGKPERFETMARLNTPAFPGGAALRYPLHLMAMLWYVLRDRL